MMVSSNKLKQSLEYRRLALSIFWVMLLAFFFANVEVQIEGAAGWAANLPTWRIEHHWLLDKFWGGRPMTGYHAWVFPFVALFFHFPLVYASQWSVKVELQALAFIMIFWIVEDFLWFVINPAYGIQHFAPQYVVWHKHWWWFAPTDYWTFISGAVLLLWVSMKVVKSA